MKEVGERLRMLRESVRLSQSKIAELIGGTTQASINRYETDKSSPPLRTLLWYADYFDVSMDYIFARTEKPQGKPYEYRPQIIESDPEMQRFVEMCFDPNSSINNRLKRTIMQMLGEAKK